MEIYDLDENIITYLKSLLCSGIAVSRKSKLCKLNCNFSLSISLSKEDWSKDQFFKITS